ncbi:hypothetical protein ACRRTK_024823 [Alexandromys fortis]
MTFPSEREISEHLEPRRDGRVPRHARETRHRARTPPPPPPTTTPTPPPHRAVPTRGLAKARMGGATEDGAGPAGERKAAAGPPRSRGASPEERKNERRSPPSGDGQRPTRPTAGGSRVPPAAAAAATVAGARARTRHASIRKRARVAARAAAAVPPRFGWCGKTEEKEDKPLCRGLTLNRSQRGSCSATYETPTQKQVVYEWFSARFHTNVRST